MITTTRLSLPVTILLLMACKADISVQNEPVDPVVQEIALAFVERPLLIAEQPFQTLLQNPAEFNPGARLILKQNAFAESAETALTAGLFAENDLYDVKDLTTSPDGLTLLFALRAPELANTPDELQPKWDLWRYDVAAKTLQPLIADQQQAQRGHDISPAFLPDGRIVFSSSRQTTSRQILLDEFKPQYTALDENLAAPAFNLHVMNADGSNIEQLTFNLSHDLYPVVLDDGHILYSRWDNHGNRSMFNWYRMRPDGSENQLVYGWHSHNSGAEQSPVEFGKAVLLQDGTVTLALASSQAPYYNSWPQQVALDIASDNEQPLFGDVLTLPAQTPLFPWAFDNTTRAERAGAINSYAPLKDNSGRYLVSWSPCRVVQNDTVYSCAQVAATDEQQLAAPLYGLWLFDTEQQTQVPVRPGREGWLVSEPTVLQAYAQPAFLPGNPALDSALVAENAGIVDIRSVYDFAGVASANLAQLSDPMQSTAAQRPVRYLRLVRGVPQPPEEVLDVPGFAFGVSRLQLMREILGAVPVAPDGSVRVKVPANVAFNLALLDAQGKAVSPLHQQWLSVRPGETLSCNGCHTVQSTAPHGRTSGEAPSANLGAVNGGNFPNTNPSLIAQSGETMAQMAARIHGETELDEALRYLDIWTDPALRQPDPTETISLQQLSTELPGGTACYTQWLASCRLRIDYPTHIQPLWLLDRRQVDLASNEVVADHTCVSCHSRTDAAGNSRVPAAQLELDAEPSDLQAQHLRSYRELLSNDNEQELIGEVLVDRLVQATDANGNPLFVTDADGNLVLDDDGNPIPVMVPVNVAPALRANSARAGSAFFNRFGSEGTHAGYLTAAELMLIAAWLDIGAQYYNSPFVVPEP
ncbi:HzsA-related protein [Rheinheimera gaetbuli]